MACVQTTFVLKFVIEVNARATLFLRKLEFGRVGFIDRRTLRTQFVNDEC